jgi:hypothetical protein
MWPWSYFSPCYWASRYWVRGASHQWAPVATLASGITAAFVAPTSSAALTSGTTLASQVVGAALATLTSGTTVAALYFPED